MRVLSPVFLNAIHAQESGEVLLPLVKLSHPDWAEDVRIVPDWKELTHDGEIYSPFPFEITLPDDEDQGIPVVRWSVDNVSQELIGPLRSVNTPVKVRIVWVLASQPDTIEVEFADLEIRQFEYDAHTISGVIGVDPILERAVSKKTMNPSTCPGLF